MSDLTLPSATIDRDEYLRRGYALPFRAMSEEDAATREALLPALKQRSQEHLGAWHKYDLHLLEPWVYDIVANQAVLDVVEGVLGPNILCWEADLFPKPPRDPGFISWHQDGTYFGLDPADGVLTAWIALTDSRPDNGCMRVIEGSHARGQIDHEETFAEDNLLSRGQSIVLSQDDEARAVDLSLKPGQFSLHHVRIVHGSTANGSDRPRIGLAVRYVAGAVTTATHGDPVLAVRGEADADRFTILDAPRQSFGKAEVAQYWKVREIRDANES